MEATWTSAEGQYDEYILGGDIGGSNANIAVVGRRFTASAASTRPQDEYAIVVKLRFDSKAVEDFSEIINESLHIVESRAPDKLPTRACICAAGPIQGNRCRPTNLSWEIDGDALGNRFSIPVRVMNDFQAICYGVPLLGTSNPESIISIPHTDGTIPQPVGETRAVAGAGTGLGVGCLTRINGSFVSLPSEGGHTGFAPFDEESTELYRYVAQRHDTAPGTELFLSGRGMTEIFKFYRDVRRLPIVGALQEVNDADDADKPPIITRHTQSDQGCRRIMEFFARIYGHFAARVSLFFLPKAGMYIAGGIVARHVGLFLENDTFMAAYENSYNPVMRGVLKTIPVYIVHDYSISLLGAAHAAVLEEERT